MPRCVKCGNEMSEIAAFCSHCGRAKATIAAEPSAAEQYRPMPTGALIMGAILSVPVMMLVATVLTFIFIWIPVIGWLAAIGAWLLVPIMPFYFYFSQRKSIAGPCPYCGARRVSAKPFDCKACKKRVLVRDGAFVRVPESP